MKEYNVGDSFWVASYNCEQEDVMCPVCYGKVRVGVILGNGDIVETPCAFCASGFESPRGCIKEYIVKPRVMNVTVAEKRSNETTNGKEYEYITPDRYIFYSKDGNIFDTEIEASTRAETLATNKQKEEDENALRRKNNQETIRTYVWGVGYHRREAKDLRERADRHERLASICKDRAKQ